MTKISFIVFSIISLIAFSINAITYSPKNDLSIPRNDKKILDLNTVNFIEIRKHNQKETTKIVRKRLSNEQTIEFVDMWNSANYNGLCKYIPVYWIDITMNDGTKRTFRINGGSIKENNDYCYNLDKNYANTVWSNAK